MASAVGQWLGDADTQKRTSKTTFVKESGIPVTTFKYYVHSDLNKQRKLGKQKRQKPLISDSTSDVICQSAIRCDNANNGLTPRQLEEKIQLVAPHLSSKQIRNHRSQTFRKKHCYKLKPKPVIARETTSGRSQCTVAQQWRWFQLVDRCIAFLVDKNKGNCKKC